MRVILSLNLIPYASVSRAVDDMILSLDLKGPASIVDSALAFWCLVLERRNTVAHSSNFQPGERLIQWLISHWRPVESLEKLNAAFYTYHATPVIINEFLFSCCGKRFPRIDTYLPRTCGSIGQAMVRLSRYRKLLNFLLLESTEDEKVNSNNYCVQIHSVALPQLSNRLSVIELQVIEFLDRQAEIVREKWNTIQSSSAMMVTTDIIYNYVGFICTASIFHSSVKLRDTTSMGVFVKKLDGLVEDLTSYLMQYVCKEPQLDGLLNCISGIIPKPGTIIDPTLSTPDFLQGLCGTILCRISHALEGKLKAAAVIAVPDTKNETDVADDDFHHMSEGSNSKLAREEMHNSKLAREEIQAICSPEAFRSYVTGLLSLFATSSELRDLPDLCGAYAAYLMQLPTPRLIMAGPLVRDFLVAGANKISDDVAANLMEHFAVELLQRYEFERCETGIGLCIDALDALVERWALINAKGEFAVFCESIYEWAVKIALEKKITSHMPRISMVRLLRRILEVNPQYGEKSDKTFAQSQFIQLLADKDIRVSFLMSHSITIMFKIFGFTDHQTVFDDIYNHLAGANNTEWAEGLAMRVCALTQLAATSFSSKKMIVYHIFETGLFDVGKAYAARSLWSVARTLGLENHCALFKIFSPQLIFTWIENEHIADFPYRVWGYGSLKQLYADVQDELAAQLLMRDKDEVLMQVASVLGISYDELLKESFSKIVAYGSAWAIGTPPNPNAPKPLTVVARVQERLGDEYRSLLIKDSALVIANLFQLMQEEGTVEKLLSRDPTLSTARNIMRDICNMGYSKEKLPVSLRPYFKAKVILSGVHYIHTKSRKNDDLNLWTPAMLVFVARRLFDIMKPSLGSLHACAVIRNMRLLICLAGPTAHEGYPLEMLLHGLKPFIVDPFCAKDTLGIVKYLLDKGRTYLSTQPAFMTGTLLSILASLRNFLSVGENIEQHDSQIRASLSEVQGFHAWLGDYLASFQFSELSERQNNTFRSIAGSAMGFILHGNAFSQTKESELFLRHLLDDDRNKNQLLDDVSRRLAFTLIGTNFERPPSFRVDIFGSDVTSIERSRVLFRTCRQFGVSQGFLLWAARILGRSYAASGQIYNEWTREIELDKIIELETGQDKLEMVPKAGIFQRIKSLLYDDDRTIVGLAEITLGLIFFAEIKSPESITFNYVFSENLYKALVWERLPIPRSKRNNPRSVVAVKKPETTNVDEWIKDLSITICTNLPSDAVAGNISPLIEKVNGLANDLFPFILHILLIDGMKNGTKLRDELSQLFRDCFKSCTEKTAPHTVILIKSILYLRTQKYVDEITKSPRDKWLDVDYLEMSRAACTCKMFKTALLFAEIHSRITGEGFHPTDILLEIFKNVDDLDSYYGVAQVPSLEEVLNRFEYEEDGWKSLSFRGANLESSMRVCSTSDVQDYSGIVDAFNTLGLNGLSHSFLQNGVAANVSLDNMFRSAWKLEQWDLSCPKSCDTRSATIYRALQSVNNDKVDSHSIPSYVDSPMLDVMHQIVAGKQTGHSLGASMRTLAVLTEMEEILISEGTSQLEEVWERLQSRTSWMHIGRYSDVEEIMAMRQAAFGSLSKRQHLRDSAQIDTKTARLIEAKSLVGCIKMARSHKVLQHSLSAATHLSKVVQPCKDVGLDLNAVATLQVANVLWDQGQRTSSIRMLQTLKDNSLSTKQCMVVGKAKLMAKLGNWISEARLEKPDKIMSNYLNLAIAELKGKFKGSEAGRVFHEFASFCDQQLQNPGNIEDYQRALKLRQNKEEEVRELGELIKSASGKKAASLRNYQYKAETWLCLDDAEFNRLKQNRVAFLEKSIGNYLRCLAACDDYDNDAVRFCALWLAHSTDPKVNEAAASDFDKVPSRKFVHLMNQLSSRLLGHSDKFQELLFPLILRICRDHPHHGIYQILALSRVDPKDTVSSARNAAATRIAAILKNDQQSGAIFHYLQSATNVYIQLAGEKIEEKNSLMRTVLSKMLYSKFELDIPSFRMPPPTMNIEVRADCDYSHLPILEKFNPEISLASGISAPKIITCRASDGRNFKMLVKGGNDDLRQDAIMEQVFEQVSSLLQKTRATRQRNLSIRTYKVIPLTTNTGIIEFVPNSIPINEFLLPAHEAYHPKDWKAIVCRTAISKVQDEPRKERIQVFRRVMRHFQPVMRYFFMHRFNGPDEWFLSRLAYSRSTAAISILGHVLGLGDRHGQNILLDEKSGEVIHIDLGVAFEQGRILPVPEVVPFRLTRDIVDGMGITKTEGVFRRCCEFTLEVLRNESYNITTILDVLRYDPLYSWTISPLRIKKMQENQFDAQYASDVPDGLKKPTKPGEEAESEADRALTVVAKKLSKTLSVSATVNELIQQASDERNLALLFAGWAAYV
ncbi:Serine/threonine-protein kinase tel1 [Rhizina undulata]